MSQTVQQRVAKPYGIRRSQAERVGIDSANKRIATQESPVFMHGPVRVVHGQIFTIASLSS